MAKLGDVCEILNGFAFRSEQYVDAGIRIIRISNVQKGYIEDSSPVFYPTDSEEAQKYRLEENDLLISLTGNVGRVAILSKTYLPAALNQRVACIRIKNENELYKPYLFHLLNSDFFESNCIKASKGVAQKNMSTQWLKDYEISLPPLAEQHRIAAVLGKITDLIAQRRAQLDKLDLLVKSRFVEMFGDAVDNSRGWDTIKLKDIGTCKNGMNFHTDDFGVKIHCLGVADFKDKSFIEGTSQLSVISLNEIPTEEYLLKNSDIVFVRSNGNKSLVGRSVLVYPGTTPTTFSGFCIRFRLESESIRPIYLLRVLKTDSVRKKLAGRGANIQNLNQKLLLELSIPVPPLELQDSFENFEKRIVQLRAPVSQSLNRLEILKKSLMQKCFFKN